MIQVLSMCRFDHCFRCGTICRTSEETPGEIRRQPLDRNCYGLTTDGDDAVVVLGWKCQNIILVEQPPSLQYLNWVCYLWEWKVSASQGCLQSISRFQAPSTHVFCYWWDNCVEQWVSTCRSWSLEAVEWPFPRGHLRPCAYLIFATLWTTVVKL